MRKTVIALAAVFLAAALSAVETIVAPRGIEAAAVVHFTKYSDAPAAQPFEVRVLRTDDALTLKVKRFKDPGKPLRSAGSPEKPDGVFGGDIVELFICPHIDRPGDFYQFAVNPERTVYQAKGLDSAWRTVKPFLVKTSVSGDQTSWTAELTFPSGCFGEVPPKNGDTWLLNICGVTAQLVFSDDPADRPHLTPESLTLKDGVYTLVFEQEPGKFVYSVNGREMGPCPKTVVFSASPEKKDGLLEIPHKGMHELRLTVRDPADGKTVYELDLCPDGSKADLLVLDSFYYDPAEDGTVELRYQAKGFEPADVTVRHLVSGAEQTFRNQAQEGAVKVKLAPGDYAFRIASAGKFTSCSFVVRAPAPAKDFSGYTMALSKDLPEQLFLKSPEGIMIPYYPVFAQGSAVTRESVGCAFWANSPIAGRVYDAGREKRLEKVSAVLKKQREKNSKPSLKQIVYEAQIGVILMDENGGLRIADNAEFYRSFYQELKKAHPEDVFSIHTDCLMRHRYLMECCDVFEDASWETSYSAPLMRALDPDLTILRTIAGKKPVIFWLGIGLPDHVIRTADELRAAVRLCILHGIAGNGTHNGHGKPPRKRPRIESVIGGIERETNEWYADWIAGRREERPRLAPVPGVRSEERILPDGTRMFLAVNLRPAEVRLPADPLYKTDGIVLPGYGTILLRSGK